VGSTSPGRDAENSSNPSMQVCRGREKGRYVPETKLSTPFLSRFSVASDEPTQQESSVHYLSSYYGAGKRSCDAPFLILFLSVDSHSFNLLSSFLSSILGSE
jgi:hypothetical protein